MFITNTIITIEGKEFTFKDEIKEYLYGYVREHPFRKFNQRIVESHENGEELFSMTFIKPNKVVLTQRYPLKQEYLTSLSFRDECYREFPEHITCEISEPFEYMD